jgi:hypothetical protein
MRGMTMTDVIRTLREVDPPPPSARLAGASTTAGEARSRLRRRAQALRSDLDWIVAKAMEKDRSRRYESAAALAMDIANDLGDRPVLARPPTITYRLGKLARRHRRALVTTLVCVMTLILGFALAKWRSGSAPASMPISAPIPIATTRPSLSPGLLAEIYEGSRFDKLVSTRVDRTIDFSWPREVTPDPSIPPTHYSIRWTGVIVIPPGGATAIGTQANDGARLFLDDQEIIDRPRRGKTIDSRPIPPGPHTIRLEYWNTLAEGRVALLWVLNDQQQTIVPETSLFHSNTKPTTQSATPQ